MQSFWGVVTLVVGLIAWLGQGLAFFAPGVAQRLGVVEPEEDMDPALYVVESRSMGLTDLLLAWTLPAAAALMLLEHPAWPLLALVGAGVFLYFSVVIVLSRVFLRRAGRKVGRPASRRLAYAFGTVGATCAVAMGVLAIAEIGGPPPPRTADTVVLVHGLGRSPASMLVLRTRLQDEGFRTVSFGYPSTSERMEVLVDSLATVVGNCCLDGSGDVHFVTHSMGGVLVRSYLDGAGPGYGGRVVMLSPPSQGSEYIDAFGDSPLLRAVLGPAATRLGTDSTGIAQELGPVDFTLGIITGDRSINPIGSWLIPGPDDGKVGVDRARVEGAAGFLVLPATHTFIMNRADVAEQVVHFLREGVFL